MQDLPEALKQFNLGKKVDNEPMPWLAALVCASPFDIAIHDAFGMVNNVPLSCLRERVFISDLASFLDPAKGSAVRFNAGYPSDFLNLTHHLKFLFGI